MAKAKKPKKKKEQDKKGGKKVVVGMIVGSLVMIVFLQMTYVLFVIGILPSIVAYYIDRTPSRQIFHTVMSCNLSGVLPFVVELAMVQENRPGALQTMIGDMSVLLIMYASAGFGWILVYTMPYVASLIIEGLNHRQVTKIKKVQENLAKEWGHEVSHVNAEA